MNDLPAMDRCPVSKSGAHSLGALIPPDADRDMTLFCERCGMVRRLPMSGEVGVPLDMLDADEIARRMTISRP